MPPRNVGIDQLAWVLGLALLASGAVAAPALTDAQVRQAIIEQSIARYPGVCACPYSAMRSGRRCGGRSAYSKPGGAAPKCFPADVSDDEVRTWRKSHR